MLSIGIEPAGLIACGLIMFVAVSIQGILGMGAALIASPLLAFLYPELLPAPLIVNGTLITLAMLIREKQHIQWSGLPPVLTGAMGGILIAGLLMSRISTDQYTIVIGLLVLIGTLMVYRKLSITVNRRNSLLAGGLCGFMHTTVSLPGPPIMLLHQNTPAKIFRPTLAVYFCISGLAALLMLSYLGRFGKQELALSIAILPGTIIGYWFSSLVIGRVQNQTLRNYVLIFSAFSGLLLVLHGVFAI